MRLLNVETFELDVFDVAHTPAYAILSHTWGKDSEEVSYNDISAGRLATAETRPNKVSGCCKQAKDDGYEYVWIDTCCIDKTDSVELQEAINSMFRWYQKAQICYVYLSDVPPGDDPQDPQSAFFSSRWFRRGWTLQELLAPPNVRFYDSEWNHLGTKGDLSDEIEDITGIPNPFLLGITELHYASVAQRMSWAAGRVTKREEDISYCLLGIFGVSMPMIYGERSKALRRLQEHIMKDIGDDSILAWGIGLEGLTPDNSSALNPGGILADHPSDFVNCGQIASRERPDNDSFDLRGGNLWLRLFLHTTAAGETLGLLNCGPEHDADKVVGIPLAATSGGQRDEYMRLKGRHAALIPKPASQDSAKLVRIRVDCERKSSATPSQSCFLHIQKTVRSLELVDVEPRSCWHRERALVEVAAGPDSDCMQRILARFHDKTKDSADFVVVLETQSSGMKARCHVLIASRQTSLQVIARNFGDMRPEALGKKSASNGILNLHVTLEPISKQRRLRLRLAASPNSPETTVNATFELHCIRRMVGIQCIEEVEEKKAREEKELSQKLEQKSPALDRAKSELRIVKEELRRIREKEKVLVKEVENGPQEMGELKAKQNEIRQQLEKMWAWRSKAQQCANKLWNSRPSAREIGNGFVWEDDQTLHFAAKNGYEDAARVLLDRGADVAAKDVEGGTPLYVAAFNGHEAVARLLLDRGADVRAQKKDGLTPLQAATSNGYEAVTSMLLDNGADVGAQKKDGLTPLHAAVFNGHEAVARLLLDKGADVGAQKKDGLTPLHAAVFNGHEGVVRLLLDTGADVAAKKEDGWTPLDMATCNGHESVVRLLLDKGANEHKDGWTPLYLAAQNGHEAVVRLLLDKGADVAAKRKDGWTPLNIATSNGHESVVRLLLDKGVNATEKDVKGWTPLHFAAYEGQEAITRLLLDKGVDVAAKNINGSTPLDMATRNGYEVITQLLLDKGAEVAAKDMDCWTPLGVADSNEYKAGMRLLLDKGVDAAVKDVDWLEAAVKLR
ncbi:hypothetical protein DL764_001906 [Monosporascus ibericus]|uniref:Uncharacterized protein n=1 Tax=Monosporascus ibericus TaxID=155417 RepID=A0A4Q4TP22_9PEZI|nr:hypothetical protein DL764_001906 [Monosporascus ibericus]